MFIKALFDYDPHEDKAIPCKEAGLSFKKGDILQIMSQDDSTWWQAKHAGDANPRAGLIPSKHFQERWAPGMQEWSLFKWPFVLCKISLEESRDKVSTKTLL